MRNAPPLLIGILFTGALVAAPNTDWTGTYKGKITMLVSGDRGAIVRGLRHCQEFKMDVDQNVRQLEISVGFNCEGDGASQGGYTFTVKGDQIYYENQRVGQITADQLKIDFSRPFSGTSEKGTLNRSYYIRREDGDRFRVSYQTTFGTAKGDVGSDTLLGVATRSLKD